MKHIFIINPTAGKQDSRQRIYDMAKELREKHGLDVQCILTKKQGHATEIARRLCEEGGELPPLGRAAEEQDGLVPHGRAAPSGPRYPRGVTMRPAMQRVVALPMKTVVNMSSASWYSIIYY